MELIIYIYYIGNYSDRFVREEPLQLLLFLSQTSALFRPLPPEPHAAPPPRLLNFSLQRPLPGSKLSKADSNPRQILYSAPILALQP